MNVYLQITKYIEKLINYFLKSNFFIKILPSVAIGISLSIFFASVVAVFIGNFFLLMAVLYFPIFYFGFWKIHQKYNFHQAVSGLFFAALPLCLLVFLPFHIPASYFYITLKPYGNLNPGFWAIALTLFIFANLHVLVVNTDYFDKKFRLRQILFVITIIILGLILRAFLIEFESDDYKQTLSFWFDYIKQQGGWPALQQRGFSDYNSIYLYLLALVSYIPLDKILLIKSISILADLVGAWAVFKLVNLRYGNSSIISYLAFTAVWFWPTVWINSAVWGQCDMLYASGLLWALYFLLICRPATACAIIGLAFSVKLQSIFFICVLAGLYASRLIKLSQLIWIPFIWLLVLLPHVLSGHSFADLLLTYPRQIVRYPALTLHASSVWALVPSKLFGIFEHTGIIAALALVCLVFLTFWIKKAPSLAQNPQFWISMALFSCLSIPYLLPKMHERYFFAADVFALVYAFWMPKRFYLPILIGLASFGSYHFFLFKSDFFLPLEILSLINMTALFFIIYDLIQIYYRSEKQELSEKNNV